MQTDHVPTVLYPGTFDPFHIGHLDVIMRCIKHFKVIVGVYDAKAGVSLEKRVDVIKQSCQSLPVQVVSYQGLLVNCAREYNVSFCVRGVRNTHDWHYEQGLSAMNRQLADEFETLFIATDPSLSMLSSSWLRDILKHGGDIQPWVPGPVYHQIKSMQAYVT
jgi:pantetheine-phosphate adenylyltransferase